jgi:hypothetical protein
MYNNKFLADGGMPDESGTVDPVSGNQVPPGAMQKEVRDDINAKLSEGEFVFPADVVRYVGLERLMHIRDLAKRGLQKMNEQGQMGNADEVANPEALHGDEFSKNVDQIMSELPEDENTQTEMALGGMATDQSQFQAPPPAGTVSDQQMLNNLAPYFTSEQAPMEQPKTGLMAKKKGMV